MKSGSGSTMVFNHGRLTQCKTRYNKLWSQYSICTYKSANMLGLSHGQKELKHDLHGYDISQTWSTFWVALGCYWWCITSWNTLYIQYKALKPLSITRSESIGHFQESDPEAIWLSGYLANSNFITCNSKFLFCWNCWKHEVLRVSSLGKTS